MWQREVRQYDVGIEFVAFAHELAFGLDSRSSARKPPRFNSRNVISASDSTSSTITILSGVIGVIGVIQSRRCSYSAGRRLTSTQ
jgi:hypothetical protein